MDFDYRLHQKATYLGQNEFLRRIPIFVIIKAEFPDMYLMKPDEELIIHQLNKFGQVIHNSDLKIRDSFKAKKEDLKFEGELYTPYNE